MKWVKAPEELKSLIEGAMTGKPAEKRLMFGYPAYFANGYMCAGLFQDSLFVRLSPPQQLSLKAEHADLRSLEPMPGRPMKGYVVLPESILRDPKALGSMIDVSLQYANSLPAKVKKPSAPKPPRAGARGKGQKPEDRRKAR
jgi:hypothetical protein